MAAAVETLINHNSHIDRCILLIVESLAGFYKVLDQNGYFLEPAAIEELQLHVHTLLTEYRKMTSWAQGQHLTRWHEVPKFHYATHIADQASGGNPKYAWTYNKKT